MENFYQVVDLQCQAPKALSEINKDFWYITFQVIKPCMTSLRILCGFTQFCSCFPTIPSSTEAGFGVFFFLLATLRN